MLRCVKLFLFAESILADNAMWASLLGNEIAHRGSLGNVNMVARVKRTKFVAEALDLISFETPCRIHVSKNGGLSGQKCVLIVTMPAVNVNCVRVANL